jgi:hypothetical protein
VNLVAPTPIVASSILSSPGSSLPGGGYVALEHPNGTWTIKDVPIMGTLAAGENGNGREVDREWLTEALEKSISRLADGYVPAVHIKHHRYDENLEAPARPGAGKFIPRRIGVLRYEGREMPVLFADLVAVPSSIFHDIELGLLTYVSVEYVNFADPEIKTLSIFADEAPYFKFPLLTIGRKIRASADPQVPTVSLNSDSILAKTARKSASGGIVLFRNGGRMEDPKIPEGVSPPAAPATGEEGVKPGAEKAPDTGMLAMMTQAVTAAMQPFMAMIAKLAGSIAPVEKPAMPSANPAEPAVAGMTDSKLASLAAKVDLLTDDAEKRKDRDRVDSLVEGAVSSLKGFNVTDRMKKSIRTFAEAKDGAKFVSEYVESIKLHGIKDPSSTLAAYDAIGGGVASAVPAEVLKFSDAGQREEATKLFREFEELKKARLVNYPLSRHLELHMGRN